MFWLFEELLALQEGLLPCGWLVDSLVFLYKFMYFKISIEIQSSENNLK